MRFGWLLLAVVSRAALAQPSTTPTTDGADYQPPPDTRKDTVLQVQDERSAANIAMVAGIAGAGALAGGIGLYFHLDSKSAADKVSAHRETGTVWTQADQATYQQAHDSGVKAAVFYSIGGALVIGAVVALIVTEPKTETVVIHPRGPSISPTPGGAMLGGTWRF